MSRIRSLKPEFFRSRSLARVPLAARVTFQGLWCEADDAGRGIADPKILVGVLWPLDDDVTHIEVEQHLRALAATGHIELYQARGERFYAIANWLAHQSASMRRGDAKYPGPDEGMPWSEPQGNILHADACKDVQDARGSVLEQGAGSREGRGAGMRGKPRDRGYSPEFETWWDEYPRKLSKAEAAKAWAKAEQQEAMTPGQALASLAAWKRTWRAERRADEHVPYPATWLNRGDWRELPTAPEQQPDAIDEWFGQTLLPSPQPHLRAIDTRSIG